MHELNHTPCIIIVKPPIACLSTNINLEINYICPTNPKMSNYSWTCFTMLFHTFGYGTTCTCSFGHILIRYCPFLWYILALWRTWSFCLNVNPTSNSLVYRHVNIWTSSKMSIGQMSSSSTFEFLKMLEESTWP